MVTTSWSGARAGRGPALGFALASAALALSGLGLSLSHPRFVNLVRGYELGDALTAAAWWRR